jgi:DNA-binding response OmpR family regulator
MLDRAFVPTVVVCGEDQGMIGPLCDRLASDRFESLPAGTVEEALRLCRYRRPDIVVVDLEPSDGSGSEALRRIRGAGRLEAHVDPDVPVIALRSEAQDPWGTQDPNPVADDYLQKPLAYDDLRGSISDNRFHLSEAKNRTFSASKECRRVRNRGLFSRRNAQNGDDAARGSERAQRYSRRPSLLKWCHVCAFRRSHYSRWK